MNETFLEERINKKNVRYRASKYVIMNNQLYKCGYFTFFFLKCLTSEDRDNVLHEIYKRICGNHSRGRALIYKAMKEGYFWLFKQ